MKKRLRALADAAALAAAAALALVAVASCGDDREPQMARVVLVECEPRAGAPDCTTVVEVNGSRYAHPGTWGEPGDTFRVVIVRTAGVPPRWWPV